MNQSNPHLVDVQDSTTNHQIENSRDDTMSIFEPSPGPVIKDFTKESPGHTESSLETSDSKERRPEGILFAALDLHAELCERLQSLMDDDDYDRPPQSQSRFTELL